MVAKNWQQEIEVTVANYDYATNTNSAIPLPDTNAAEPTTVNVGKVAVRPKNQMIALNL
ncbi:hypothetical protein AIOL_001419 [Candidatus Rhodobacter oscarellae]|uniref:Uncharacterized protein n=1 Tax=Candidatus Rhodobacter oscarellae TaxID=1675527 RepID=A0A0J9E152_9RHOB|nr:hypothetical protein AIOL_001419 [Candidatus Rhodobacter lobularis]